MRLTDEMVENGLRAWLDWPDGTSVVGHSQLPRMKAALASCYKVSRVGRPGGKVGGLARAASLSPERRKEIAKAAARSRWKNA